MRILLSLLILTLSFESHASLVAIVDSGFFNEHDLLNEKLWTNNAEKTNRIDDDQNGYVDDLHGWNFADNSKTLFDISQVDDVSPLTYEIIRVAGRMTAGTASEEDEAFLKKEVIDKPVPERNRIVEEINFYGQYAHGTHVAGIVTKENPAAELMNLRFFPLASSPYPVQRQSLLGKIEDYAFAALSDLSNTVFDQVAAYVGKAQADVVNMSLGIPMERFAKWTLFLKGKKEPTTEEIGVESTKIYKKFEARALEWAVVAPNTLFVVAAGNFAQDNDVIPAFPANVDNPNILSVAATIGVSKLPEFSNYGKTSVDVAAPGVNVLSSAPGPNSNFQIEMTGTSMAAPYVAGVASRVKDANPNLSAVELKKILTDTVDVKDWLKDKVVTSGLINPERAIYAARKAMQSNLIDAISESIVAVPDQEEDASLRSFPEYEKKTSNFLKKIVF